MKHFVAAVIVATMCPALAAGQQAVTPPAGAGPLPPLSEMPWASQALGRPANENDFAKYQMVPGLPFQIIPRNNMQLQPSFPEQTRAAFRSATPYDLVQITDKLHLPWGMAYLPSGNLLITEKNPGRLLIVDRRGGISEISGIGAASKSPKYGLLSLVLDPKFAENKKIYFAFFELMWRPYAASFREPSVIFSNINVASAQLDEAAHTVRNVKTIYRSRPEVILNPSLKMGGGIAFDREGNLFVTIGPRSADNPEAAAISQQLDTPLGKVIRIRTDGAPAVGNPYLGQLGVAPEIWAVGLRSPEGLTVDPATGKLWVTDHGMMGGDELNLIRKGGNYGWPAVTYGLAYNGQPFQGNLAKKPGMEEPNYYWDPVIAPSSVAVYRGALFPNWNGNVLVSGLRGRVVSRLVLGSEDKVIEEEPLFTELKTPIRRVAVGGDGAVYLLTDVGGLWKVTPKR